ncbi:MAG TPA: protein kinase [Gemmatimonadales bacterium]|nr:protein kinase [Gemmatimonadales bacterium]
MPTGKDSISSDALAELRHDLRTPLNHVIGYAEMLLEDAADPSLAARRAGLEETLVAAREALDLINTAIGSTKHAGQERIQQLYDDLRAPRTRIVQAVTALLSASNGEDGAFTADLAKILSAAERLGAAPAPAPATPDAKAAAAPAAGAATSRILVVDDGAENREVLKRRLERSGHAVETAENGRRALEILRSSGFDLVLLDVLMPELDGFAVLEAIKSDPALRDIPVIMISALDEMPSIVRCIERGAEDYLHKPFDPVLLRARINASLEKKKLRDQEVEYLREVRRVTDAATAVQGGHYDSESLAPVARRADELGNLARVFDNMVLQMKVREDRLKNQVQDLRQEIEHARRDSKAMAVMDGGNLNTGERLGQRYEILAVLGRGGMGTVYRARDLELQEEVAIKTLRPELMTDAALLERFKDEIRLARRLSDPNIVRTHDFGEWSGVYYLTMEYVEGITVRELLDTRRRLTVPSTLALARQLAHSLAVAHEHGVIHRDIKPQNLLLDAAGVLKVMDFGVARLAERSIGITEAGLVLGTPSYMPPEQIMAEGVDARSDLYAAGVVLYECLTGQLPHEAVSMMALIAKLLNEEVPRPETINPEVPPALSALVVKLLAKAPDERIQTAAALFEQLGPLG